MNAEDIDLFRVAPRRVYIQFQCLFAVGHWQLLNLDPDSRWGWYFEILVVADVNVFPVAVVAFEVPHITVALFRL